MNTAEIQYCISTNEILALWKRMGYVYKKSKEFVEEYQELKNNLAEKDQIYFVDGVHPQHNSIVNYGWIKRGQTKHHK